MHFKIIFQIVIVFSCFDNIKSHTCIYMHLLWVQCNLKPFRLYPFNSLISWKADRIGVFISILQMERKGTDFTVVAGWLVIEFGYLGLNSTVRVWKTFIIRVLKQKLLFCKCQVNSLFKKRWIERHKTYSLCSLWKEAIPRFSRGKAALKNSGRMVC